MVQLQVERPSSVIELAAFQRQHDFDQIKSVHRRHSSSTAASSEEDLACNERVIPSFNRVCTDRSFLTDYEPQTHVLGTGINGEVRQAKCLSTGRFVAVKSFNKTMLPARKLEDMRREVEIQLEADHPHIARLERVYETEAEVTLVMERLEGGELFDRLLKCQKIKEEAAAGILQQLLLAVSYLHGRGLLHRDVKLENVMFTRKGGDQLKLIDFGFATRWDGAFELTQRCGTLHYVAPEVLKGSYDSKCDLWSIGVVAYMLLTGKSLYGGDDEIVRRKVIRGTPDWSRSFFALSETCQDFVRQLLKVCPKQRPSAQKMLEHPWLQVCTKSVIPQAPPRMVLRRLQAAALTSKARRACLASIAWCLPPEVEESFHKQFMALDIDHDGVISLQDLSESLCKASLGNFEEAKELLRALDCDGDGMLSFHDFLAAAGPAEAAGEETILAAFRRFDQSPRQHGQKEDMCSLKQVEFMLGGALGGIRLKEFAHGLTPKREDSILRFREFYEFVRTPKADPHTDTESCSSDEDSVYETQSSVCTGPPRKGKVLANFSGCGAQQVAGGVFVILDLVQAMRYLWSTAVKVAKRKIA